MIEGRCRALRWRLLRFGVGCPPSRHFPTPLYLFLSLSLFLLLARSLALPSLLPSLSLFLYHLYPPSIFFVSFGAIFVGQGNGFLFRNDS